MCTRRTIVAAALLVLCGFLAVATAQKEAAAAKAVKLTFWYSGPKPAMEFMAQVIAEYEKQNPKMKIELVETPPGRERIATALASKQGPDILWYNQNVTWFFGEEVVHPLNKYVFDPKIGIDGSQYRLDTRYSAHYGGKLVALPLTGGGGAIKINRRMFKDAGLSEATPPQTWDQFIEVAKKLTKFQPDGKTPVQWGFDVAAVDWMMQEILFANGGDWVNDDCTEYLPEPQKLVEGLQWWHDMTFKHRVMPIARGVTWIGAAEMTAPELGFQNEKAAMHLGDVGGIVGMVVNNPNLKDNIAQFPIPRGPAVRPGQKIKISSGFGGPIIMSEAAGAGKNPLEAYLFMKWLGEKKSVDLARVAGAFPAHLGALKDPFFAESPEYGRMTKWFAENLPRNFHVFPGRLDVRAKEPQMAESVLLGKATPAAAVAEFKKHADEQFRIHAKDLETFRKNHKIIF